MSNIIRLYGSVGAAWGEITATTIAEQLDAMKNAGAQAVEVHINSEGGDVFDGLAIHNLLMRSGLGVIVHIDGLAASAAALIAMAGHRIIAEPSAILMIHNSWCVAAGNAAEFVKLAKELEVVDQAIAGIFASRTGQSLDKIRELLDAETWMSAEDAFAGGFVDEIAPRDGSDEELEREVERDPTIPFPESRSRRDARAALAWMESRLTRAS